MWIDERGISVSQQGNRYFIFNMSEKTNIFTNLIAQKRNMVIPGQLFVNDSIREFGLAFIDTNLICYFNCKLKKQNSITRHE